MRHSVSMRWCLLRIQCFFGPCDILWHWSICACKSRRAQWKTALQLRDNNYCKMWFVKAFEYMFLRSAPILILRFKGQWYFEKCNYDQIHINPSRLSGAYIRQRIRPSWIQIKECCLLGANLLSVPVLPYFQLTLLNNFHSNINWKSTIFHKNVPSKIPCTNWRLFCEVQVGYPPSQVVSQSC